MSTPHATQTGRLATLNDRLAAVYLIIGMLGAFLTLVGTPVATVLGTDPLLVALFSTTWLVAGVGGHYAHSQAEGSA